MIEKHKNKLLEIVRFSNLSNEKEDNIPVNMKYLWDDILSNHPTTKIELIVLGGTWSEVNVYYLYFLLTLSTESAYESNGDC